MKNQLFSFPEDDECVTYAELIKNYPAVLKPQEPESTEKQPKTFHTPQDDERQLSVVYSRFRQLSAFTKRAHY